MIFRMNFRFAHCKKGTFEVEFKTFKERERERDRERDRDRDRE